MRKAISCLVVMLMLNSCVQRYQGQTGEGYSISLALSPSDWIGFIGVSILLVAFLLNLLKKIEQDSLTYILLNLIGAGLACLASFIINYVPFVILEGTWALVSTISLILYFKKR